MTLIDLFIMLGIESAAEINGIVLNRVGLDGNI